jgi:hypothetical protein
LADAREFIRWYADLDRPKADAVILLSSFLGRSRIADAIQKCGLNWKIVGERTVPLHASDTYR